MMHLPAVVEQLSFTYAGRSAPSLRGIDCTIEPGSWTVMVGGTGSGKSTLLRALAGLIPRHSAGQMSGSVRLFGRDTRDASTSALAQLVGLVLQSPDDQICTTQVESEVAFGLENLACPPAEIATRIGQALSAVDLEPARYRRTAELSGGQKQRLVLASVLALRPRLLLLDEPFSQLDAASTQELLAELDRLRAHGVTIVIAEHRLHDVLPRADRVWVLQQGKIVFAAAPQDGRLPAAFAAADLDPPEMSTDIRHEFRPAQEPASAPAASLELPAVAEVRNLVYAYSRAQAATPTLRNLSFNIRPGERVALVGPNGSGKSTLLNLLAGLTAPTAGTIGISPAKAAHYPVGLVLQQADLMLFCRTVREELAYGPRRMGLAETIVEARILQVARQLDLDSLLDEAPQALSQGQRLRVAVAATMTLQPALLLLDEPTTGLDRRQISRLMQAIDTARVADDGARQAVLFSTHDLRTVANFADRVIVLDRGELVVDQPAREFFGSTSGGA